jgi:hypothetical protein
MAIIECTECGGKISDEAPSCPHCGKSYSDTTQQPSSVEAGEAEKSVSLLLGIGVFIAPYIFSWFTLRGGYSNRARITSFIWMFIFLAALAADPDEQSGSASVAERTVTSSQPTAAPGLTRAQKNAVRSAKAYINMSGFSRDGLIQQLSSEYGDGYKVADATVAVDSLGIDWNENAVRSAKQYLDMSGFSCKGLIQQLSSSAGDKYTVSQATYGARKAGAC